MTPSPSARVPYTGHLTHPPTPVTGWTILAYGGLALAAALLDMLLLVPR